MTQLKVICIAVPLLCALMMSSSLRSQDVIMHRDAHEKLSKRFEWAANEVQKRKLRSGFWIGYSIERLMGEKSFIGTIHHPPRPDEISLLELLYDERPTVVPTLEGDESLRRAAEAALAIIDEKKDPPKLILKEVAILFGFHSGDSGWQQVQKIRISNVSLSVALENRPLFWLGGAAQEESVEFLTRRFEEIKQLPIRKRVVSAIALHADTPGTLPVVQRIALNDPEPQIRKEGVYGLSKFISDKVALATLEEIAFGDPEVSVQKEAIYRISQSRDPVSLLIDLSRSHEKAGVRKEAIYRLAQHNSSTEAVAALEEIVFDDPETGVQKEALYRVAQMTGAESKLITVAKTHSDVSVRKDAIYRLAQAKPSAIGIRALEDLAFNDPDISVQKETVYRISHLPDAFDRLIAIAQTHDNSSVRKEAIYRLAQNKKSEKTVPALASITFEDLDVAVQKEAVYRFAQISTSESDQLLIRVAKTHPERTIRKEAIYRLVERASKKSVDTLADITFEDADAKIQKEALYAISRLDNNTSIPLLIKIATTHSSPKLRKEAIYRLGQSEDKRAIDALERIVLQK